MIEYPKHDWHVEFGQKKYCSTAGPTRSIRPAAVPYCHEQYNKISIMGIMKK